ncbi:aldo/keto reductase KNAG_0L01270 [Huiozyma naganishii CBS 8797]|uniref:NADP-dependent oxidoreductase domain-containing protein n=1 Tax=Huiozyma naganishii (strain ATCC MYA-139 / BCRC 22969 / CBS 8797 / KCTC 17520 / NBRC 10181 / NCYC 3082 / Yp74L-3) TaxID=1071383 RepID=J7S3P6_HUIN7|nr:hypothetical protein KNAG_0L01270 [Kazachstania naganishii CBS 8797]CCK72747.1 hypothetical protein KNAG_0L01270 [Kazachstania naganishii CBS 8797]
MSVVNQVRFGNTGMKISPFIVGCMSYGDRKFRPWVLEDEEKVFEILKYCYDHGVRTFDTANVYCNGASERLLGKFLKKYNINRETVVILTKVYFPVDESLEPFDFTVGGKNDPLTDVTLSNQRGLSRKNIIASVDKSIERLGTYIDVLQIHRLDHECTGKEIMKALNDVVESNKVRYIGASTMLATEFVELQMIADKYDWFQFVSSQTEYSLLFREDERELLSYTKRNNLAVLPWSPNARGLLCRPLGTKTERSTTESRMLLNMSESDKLIVKRVEELAKKKNVSMAMISEAWVMSKGYQPIIGFSSVERVKEAIEATKIELTDDEIKYLEEPYQPKKYAIVT